MSVNKRYVKAERRQLARGCEVAVQGFKRLNIALAMMCLGLLVISGCLYWNYAILNIRISLAAGQIEIFAEMRERAIQSDAYEAARCLEYIVSYYPSGTKQVTGSRLDHIVEREREVAVREIVAHLQKKTGDDLGTDAVAWIEKYAKE